MPGNHYQVLRSTSLLRYIMDLSVEAATMDGAWWGSRGMYVAPIFSEAPHYKSMRLKLYQGMRHPATKC